MIAVFVIIGVIAILLSILAFVVGANQPHAGDGFIYFSFGSFVVGHFCFLAAALAALFGA